MSTMYTLFCSVCAKHRSNCRCSKPVWEHHDKSMTEPDFAQILVNRKRDKPSYTPKVDLKKMVVKIPVMQYQTGDGKILYSDNCDPDIVKKFCIQYERRNMGVRTVQLVMLDRDWYSALKESEVAVLLVN